MNNMQGKMRQYPHTKDVSRKAGAQGFSQLALSMVLPHENKPVRFPVIPATHTALLDTMCDGTVPIPDNSARRAFLCRDASYPLWMTRTLVGCSTGLKTVGSPTTWNIPVKNNAQLTAPVWGSIESATSAATLDGVTLSNSGLSDLTVLGDLPTVGTQAIYIPPGSTFTLFVNTGAIGNGSGIEFEIAYQVGGEEFIATVVAGSVTNGFLYQGVAGTAVAAGGNGIVPYGFAWFKQWRTTVSAPSAASTPSLYMGWTTGGTFTAPSGTATLMVPYAMPPEFNNSVIPYARTRLNSSAALFTNVTAALSKEGTVLAARLKPAVVDPWNFTTDNLNAVHPSLRYFGPLEKGLYTFTTPSGNTGEFYDCVISMPSNSTYNPLHRPLFQFADVGIYNAIIFSDLGSSSAGTQLAVSSYSHLEFETTSSLFSIGVSSQPLELLHATEVALLKFGHFHENPIHWAYLASAVRTAMAHLAPLALPYVKQAANYVLDRGVQYLTSKKAAGDRSMPQRQMVEVRAQQPKRPKRGKNVQLRKKK